VARASGILCERICRDCFEKLNLFFLIKMS
jgi:hypothetical protein